MQIELKRSTGEYVSIPEFLKFSQICGRQCYSEKDFDELEKESFNPKLINKTLRIGHHSIYGHEHLTFSFKGLPKALAMILNNEKQYVTSEKSARYTQMKKIEANQQEKYDKWMEILQPEIGKVYPGNMDSEQRNGAIKKLAQENARYMTSVFTPTKMIHTINLRQLNHLAYSMEEFIEENGEKNEFNRILSETMNEFLKQVEPLRVDKLKNQTDRHLSFFGEPVEEHFGDVYSTNYLMSFAGLAQAQRHRTINYQVTDNIELGAPLGFFRPGLVRATRKLSDEWYNDLDELAEHDFPQAQIIQISERGIKEDFRSKLILRLCGHAQYEIMEKTKEIAKEYAEHGLDPQWLDPKCLQGMECAGACVWGGNNALERIV